MATKKKDDTLAGGDADGFDIESDEYDKAFNEVDEGPDPVEAMFAKAKLALGEPEKADEDEDEAPAGEDTDADAEEQDADAGAGEEDEDEKGEGGEQDEQDAGTGDADEKEDAPAIDAATAKELEELRAFKAARDAQDADAAKAERKAAADAKAAARKALDESIDATMEEWKDSDPEGAPLMKALFKKFLEAMPDAASGGLSEKQVRAMLEERAAQQSKDERDIARMTEELGGEWWRDALTDGHAEKKEFDGWLAKQPKVVQAGAQSAEAEDLLFTMSLYRDHAGKGTKSEKTDDAADGVVDEVKRARETRKRGAKAAPASVGSPQGSKRDARTDADDFDAGWELGGKDDEDHLPPGYMALMKKVGAK